MAITRIGNPAIADQRGINFRNIIINGGMDVAQRGTSATGLGNGDTGYHTCDRWKFNEGGPVTFEFTQSQSTDVPSGQGFANSLKYDCTTAQASLASSDYLIGCDYSVEGQDLQYLKFGTSSAEYLTMSFWVKSNKTGTYIFEMTIRDGTSQAISKSYTIDSSNTWEKKTIIIPPNTARTIVNDNTAGMDMFFWLAAGSDWTSGSLNNSWTASPASANRAVGQVNLADSTSNEWYITGVQLEAGQVASDFEFLPIDVKLARCQRYFTKSYDPGTAPGSVTYLGAVSTRNYSTSTRGQNPWPIIFKQTMRTVPTITIYSPTTGSSGFITTGATGHGGTTQAAASTIYNAGQRAIAGMSATITATHFGECHYTADAEL